MNLIVKKNKLDISTLAIKIKNKKVLNNKNIVKVVTEKKLNYKQPCKAKKFLEIQKKNIKIFINI